MSILGTYEITYASDGRTQIKNLVSHTHYENDIKPSLMKADEIKKKKPVEAEAIKRRLKSTYGEYWFTDKSPIFDAIASGTLIHYGGKCDVSIKQITNG